MTCAAAAISSTFSAAIFLSSLFLSRMSPWHRELANGQNAGTRSRFRSWLPPLNFITIHYAYFISVCLITSIIFWVSSSPAWSISYTDSLFLVVSAMTEAGLNTVNLSQMTTWQQVILFLLIMFGSSIWVSIWTVVARKHVFETRFRDIVRAERLRRMSNTGSAISLPRLRRLLSIRKPPETVLPQNVVDSRSNGTVGQSNVLPYLESGTNEPWPASAPRAATSAPPTASMAAEEQPGIPHIVFVDKLQANGAASTAAQQHTQENQPTLRNRNPKSANGENGKHEFAMGHFLAKRAGGRNAQFHGLTSEERDRLGGCEYQALRVLSVVVPLYFVLWQLLGCLALGAWINNNMPEPPLKNGIKPWWLGIFNGVSAFNNSGMTLLDANMIPFQSSYFVLITMGLLILAGNTAYPIFLRLIIWSLLKVLSAVTKGDECSDLKDTFRFILQYPRRVYTNLFPARPTWWLLFMLILLNSIDWVAFELLNLGNTAMESIPRGSRVLDGLFQALGKASFPHVVLALAAC